ncbi:carbohydrate kinase family protein [Patescibacteria group bacterium]|nr:carbohydrate kinase family protein [Patescibacteria group bacterium]
MLDILSIGHATIDFFLELDPETAPLVWSKTKKDSFVCLDFDDKTPVRSAHWSVGGNAVNSGIGFARLGLNTALVSEVGDDEWGRVIQRTIEQEKLGLEHFFVNTGQVTDLSVILNLHGQRTILSYHYPREYQFPKELPSTRWVYLTSLGERFPGFHLKLLSRFHDSFKLAYNPGVHELRAGLEANIKIIEKCTVLLVNREEAGTFLGQRPAEVTEGLLKSLYDLGSKIVVITDGKNGSFAYDGQAFYRQQIFPTEFIEATGAGDAFAAGFLSALVYGEGTVEALRWGTANSSSVIQYIGSTEGLLTGEEMKGKIT